MNRSQLVNGILAITGNAEGDFTMRLRINNLLDKWEKELIKSQSSEATE